MCYQTQGEPRSLTSWTRAYNKALAPADLSWLQRLHAHQHSTHMRRLRQSTGQWASGSTSAGAPEAVSGVPLCSTCCERQVCTSLNLICMCADTTQYPFATIGKPPERAGNTGIPLRAHGVRACLGAIYLNYPDGSQALCSGALVTANAVLTVRATPAGALRGT